MNQRPDRKLWKCRSILLSAITFLAVCQLTDAQDCANYVVINDGRRSVLNQFDELTDTPICDDDLNPNTWYRFNSYVGAQIPEREPPDTVPVFRCGTQIPMYIKGTNVHPTQDGETVYVTTCENKGLSDNGYCNVEGTSLVHRCPAVDGTGSFYIYRLVPPTGCHAAFCAGENPACENDLMWNGFECVSYFPAISGTPQFSGPLTTETGTATQIYFRCFINYNRVANDAFASFKFTFLFDDFELVDLPSPPYNKLPSFIIYANDIEQNEIHVDLTEFYLRGRLGRTISCQVQTFWKDQPDLSDPLKSAYSYKVAIESDTPIIHFDLNNNTLQSFVFRSTVPLTCFHCTKYPCQGCRYTFPVQHSPLASDCYLFWKNGITADLVIQVKPNGRTTVYELKFTEYNADKLQNYESLWHGYTVPPVTVIVYTSDKDNKRCSSSGDPHIKTFDNSFTYDNYLNGDFSLVSAEFENHKLEIQIHQEKCGKVTCNCAIIVREFNSAYKLGWETCGLHGAKNRRFAVIELLLQKPSDGSTVMGDKTGNKYSVRMASGLRVEIDKTSQELGYTVYLPPEYHSKTKQISQCGDSDGHQDAIPNSEISRLKDDANNYFKTQPECDARYFFPLPKACDCDLSSGSTKVSCSSTESDLETKTKANTPLGPLLRTGIDCYHPDYVPFAISYSESSKSDYILDPAEIYRPYEIDPDHGKSLTVSWPTPNGKTEQGVEEYCRNELMTSAVYSDCESNADIDEIVGNCKADIQIMDEYISVNAYREFMEEKCVNTLIWKEYQTNSTNSTLESEEFMAVYNKICPNQCSGHGTCSDSVCTCETGYVGDDCSIDQSQPPQVTELFRDGLCNIQERPCATITVYGVGLYGSEDLKCRFKDLKTGSTEETNGTFITSNEVRCSVPATSGEKLSVTRKEISLSNDGKLFGSGEQLLVYDSTCMSCGQDKACTQTADSCLISERCYMNGATDKNSCSQCIPSKSSTSWTVRPVVEKLEPCSRECDYAAQAKQTLCSLNNQLMSSEPLLCKQNDCPDIPTEKSEGVIITMSKEDLTKVMLTPTLILSAVTDAVNGYCSEFATECCNSVGVPDGHSLTKFTSLELCPYGAGYPKVDENSAARVKVIVKFIPQDVQQKCVQTSPQKQSTEEAAYASPDILVSAVSRAKAGIEKNLNIEILSVAKDGEKDSKSAAMISRDFTPILVFGAFVSFLLNYLA